MHVSFVHLLFGGGGGRGCLGLVVSLAGGLADSSRGSSSSSRGSRGGVCCAHRVECHARLLRDGLQVGSGLASKELLGGLE
jgi:hypothetical protein